MQQGKKRAGHREHFSLHNISEEYFARLLERLWAYTDIRGNDDCWPWLGPIVRPSFPYGSMKLKIGDRHCSMNAHRFMWLVEHPLEELPESVCHSCDNSMCINPKHLFAGTQIDNIRDCISKGRNARGSMFSHSKLTESDVLAIRADRRPHKEIEAEYGLGRKYVSAIKNKRWWKWL